MENYELRKCREILSDIEPGVARILSKVEHECKSDIIQELCNDVDDDLVCETRELIFKAATCRYIELLENSGYDPTVGVPVLILKRRKGDQMRVINCKDVVDLLVFASGFSDIFPRDTLSSPGSKYVEIKPKSNSVDTSAQVLKDNPSLNNDTFDISMLTNRIRDQEILIQGLKDDLNRTRTELVNKVDSVAQLLHVLLKYHGINTGMRMTRNHVAQGNSIADTINSIANAGHVESTIALACSSDPPSHADVLPPHGLGVNNNRKDVIADNEPQGVASVADSEQSLTVDVPSGSTTRRQNDSGSSSDNQPQDRMQYSEAASIPGAWSLQQSRRNRRQKYRDERDHYEGGNTANPGKSGNKPDVSLKGASHERLCTLYVRNIEITDDDNDESIVNNVRRYCQSKGIKTVRANVIYNRYNDYVVGCKVSIAASQKQKLLAVGFWPHDITCREWQKSASTNVRRDVTSYDKDTNTLSRTVATNVSNDNDRSGHSWGSQGDIVLRTT